MTLRIVRIELDKEVNVISIVVGDDAGNLYSCGDVKVEGTDYGEIINSEQVEMKLMIPKED